MLCQYKCIITLFNDASRQSQLALHGWQSGAIVSGNARRAGCRASGRRATADAEHRQDPAASDVPDGRVHQRARQPNGAEQDICLSLSQDEASAVSGALRDQGQTGDSTDAR